jgi:hypothetical protein
VVPLAAAVRSVFLVGDDHLAVEHADGQVTHVGIEPDPLRGPVLRVWAQPDPV